MPIDLLGNLIGEKPKDNPVAPAVPYDATIKDTRPCVVTKINKTTAFLINSDSKYLFD